MKYFIDTEFLEGTQRESFPISLFRKESPNTIDLISIGIVAEDTPSFSKREGFSDRTYGGREYYAVSKDFNLKEAWNRYDTIMGIPGTPSHRKSYWIRDNVLKPIYYGFINKDINFHDYDKRFTYFNFKMLLNKYGKTNKEIAKEIRNFIYSENIDKGGQTILGSFLPNEYPTPEFYAYYADYDWVVFCWLFGKMKDLPKGFPMYCKDLKQMLDEKVESLSIESENVSSSLNYPKKENEHNAISDARWNKKLYEFLTQL
jgi:DNA polymerase III epsilon subunit-like protein